MKDKTSRFIRHSKSIVYLLFIWACFGIIISTLLVGIVSILFNCADSAILCNTFGIQSYFLRIGEICFDGFMVLGIVFLIWSIFVDWIKVRIWGDRI